MILLTVCDYIGESLQTIVPLKPFDCLEGLDAVRVFFVFKNALLRRGGHLSAGAAPLFHTPPRINTAIRQLCRSKPTSRVWMCASPEAHGVSNVCR